MNGSYMTSAMAAGAYAAIVFFTSASAAAAQEPFRGLDSYIANAAKASKIPGLAVAIVRNDSVIYAKGFGALSLTDPTPVNERTLFEIGSASKSFTATVVAMLVSDGKMAYDDLVSKYLPDIQLADPVATENLTIRDALSHRSGIGRAGDQVWSMSNMSREELIHRARFIPTESVFRSRYAYQNIMYVAAGEASGKAAGSTWDDLVIQRIFTPLGMTSSLPTYRGLRTTNVAKPHGRAGDSLYVLPQFNAGGNHNIGPAGTILSSAQDMAQWLRFQINDGVVNGKRLVSSAALQETHAPQILTGPAGGPSDTGVTNFNAYGMGWFLQDYRGQLMWQHGGNTTGMTTAMAVLPKKKIGVVVVSSLSQTPMPAQLVRYIFDHELGVTPVRDYIAEGLARGGRGGRGATGVAAQGAAPAPRGGGTAPLPLASFVGVYTDSLLGDVTVALRSGQLHVTRGELTGPLEYWNATNFRWTTVTGRRYIKFDISPDNRVTGLFYGSGSGRLLSRKNEGGRGGRGGRGNQ